MLTDALGDLTMPHIMFLTKETTEMACERKFRTAIRVGGSRSTSVAIVIPPDFLRSLGITPKTNVQIDLVDGKRLVIVNADRGLNTKAEVVQR
jgi:antitoxin component of MazEF toxin-antitoxin module